MELKVLSRICAEVLHVDPREVTGDMTLAEDLDADSLDLYQILMKTEEAFGIRVTERDCRTLRTVEDMIRMVRQKTGKSNTSGTEQ